MTTRMVSLVCPVSCLSRLVLHSNPYCSFLLLKDLEIIPWQQPNKESNQKKPSMCDDVARHVPCILMAISPTCILHDGTTKQTNEMYCIKTAWRVGRTMSLCARRYNANRPAQDVIFWTTYQSVSESDWIFLKAWQILKNFKYQS